MNRIKEIRKELGFSIYKIAEMTGLAPSYISNLENGRKTNPSLMKMQKISNALNKRVEDVFILNEKISEEVS